MEISAGGNAEHAKAFNVASNWTEPTSENTDSASKNPPKNTDAVDGYNVSKNVKLTTFHPLSDAVKAVVDLWGVFDLRTDEPNPTRQHTPFTYVNMDAPRKVAEYTVVKK